jgi:hypothetical protein
VEDAVILLTINPWETPCLGGWEAVQKWEYCLVRGYWLGGDGHLYIQQPSVCYFTPDGPVYEKVGDRVDKDGTAIARKIAQLGEEGWEACGMVVSDYPTTNTLFKRPKP